MADSVLTRSRSVAISQGSPINPTQIQVDGLVTRFVEEASSPITLGSLVVGSGMYRFARLGTMGVLEGRLAAPAVRFLSYGTGLFSEAASFQLANRSLRIGFDGADPRTLQLGGSNGLAIGTLESMITFGSLRGAGFLAREENIVFQHALQATTMVGGHQLTGRLGLTNAPEGTLAQQLLDAEVTNLQLMAGMGLVHSLTGGRLEAAERALDLSLHSRDAAGEGIRIPFLASLAPRLEMALASEGGRPSSHEEIGDLMRRPVLMEIKGEGGPEIGGGAGPRESSSPREPVQADRVIESLRQFIKNAREAADPQRERLPEEDFAELKRLAQHFRENPKELVETLTKIKEMVEQGDVEESIGQVLKELRNTKRSPERNAKIAREALENMPLNRASFMSARHLLPNGLTIAAAICAAVSIVEASEGRHEIAAVLLPIAAVLDKLDGGVARATNASHPIGAGLDSYADFAAYGMASAFFTRAVLVSHGMPEIGNALAGIIFSHALLRLAVFDFLGSNGHVLPTHDIIGNPVSRDRSDFVGMPSTMVGLYAGLAYLAFRNNPEAFALAMGAAGSAMFWPLRYVKFGNNFKNDSDNPLRRIMTIFNVVAPAAAGGALAVVNDNPQYLSYGLALGALTYVVSPFFERAALAVNRWRNGGTPTPSSSTTTNVPNPNVPLQKEAPPAEPSSQDSDRAPGERVRVAAVTGEGNDSGQGHPDREQGEAQGFLDPADLTEEEDDLPPTRQERKK